MRPFGRRRFLAAAVASAALTACTDGADEPQPRAGAGGGDVPDPDLDALELIAQLEVVARNAYRDSAAASDAGRLGAMPAAGVEFLKSAAAQHGDALEALNALLRGNERPAVEEGHVEFETVTVGPPLEQLKSWGEVAALARNVEVALAATDLEAIHSTLQSPAPIRLVAGLQATSQKRVAVLNFLLGEFPSPDTFQKTDAAIAP